MSFSGKATYSAGPSLPEIAEDVSDLVAINSPHDTPLLDALGDPPRPARSTVHEWLEDSLLPDTASVNDGSIASPTGETTFGVSEASRFRAGDQLRIGDSSEIALVTGVDVGSGTITVTRGYGGTTPTALVNGAKLSILGNAALEG
ncbi:MAG: DUF5309 domain-containing protein, partial [Phycisphaerae bacterium]|nr:DUF5309 domain-containing protein [Phycisphaerae bacterium]